MPKEAVVPERAAAAAAKMTETTTPPRVFADPQTETTWRIREAIGRIAHSLPPHGTPTHHIRFAADDEVAGASILLFAGDIGPLDNEGTNLFRVSDRSIAAFRKLGIRFTIEEP